MTLPESTQRAHAAIAEGDLESLEGALRLRAAAIEALHNSAPSVELASEITAAIQSGNELLAELGRLKQQLRCEHGTLRQLKKGLSSVLAPANSRIDCRG